MFVLSTVGLCIVCLSRVGNGTNQLNRSRFLVKYGANSPVLKGQEGGMKVRVEKRLHMGKDIFLGGERGGV